MRYPITAAVLVSLLAAGAGARAQDQDAASRAATTLTAVELADAAGELFQGGKFNEALDRYQRADALVHRHAIGLRIARCLVKLNRLNEAAARYEAVVRATLPTDLEPDKLAKQKEAQAQAQAEREALLPHIPGIVVQLSGPPGVVVTLDGQQLPAALLGVKRSIDPGAHRIEARLGEEVVTRDVTVKEGEVPLVPLEIRARQNVATPPPPLPQLPASDTGRPRRVAGAVVLGTGVAVLAFGAIAGGVAVSKYNDLKQPGLCGDHFQSCAAIATDEVNSYNTNRHLATFGLVAGGVLAAGGVVLVVTALPPKGAPPVALALGPNGVGVKGAF